MSDNSTELSLREAAEASGVSKDTVWRAVRAGQLPARSLKTAKGFYYSISRDALQEWCRLRMSDPTPSDVASDASGAAPNALRQGQMSGQTSSDVVPLAAHLAALASIEQAHQQADRLFDRLAAVEAQLELERLARDEERTLREQITRQNDALGFELTQHRRALSESAESLAEVRAAAATAEAQRLAVEQQLAELATVTAQAEAERLAAQLEAGRLADLQKLKVDTRPASRGWGSRLRSLLTRKIG